MPAGTVSAHTVFSADAAQEMADSISEYSGQEIFFGGYTDDEGIVTEITILARGNDNQVPVPIQAAVDYHVVIHNHPESNLKPSDPDLEIASGLAGYNIGFYIIDNAVRSVNIVIPREKQIRLLPVETADIDSVFSSGGILSEFFHAYESRPGQIHMSHGVSHAFNHNAIYVCEAGTGTGKSLAYLIPSLHWIHNNSQKVIISTHTINLQEQLLHKDIPLAVKATGFTEIRACLVKGRSNYLCIRRYAEAVRDGGFLTGFFDNPDALKNGGGDAWSTLTEWADATKTGDKSELSFLPPPYLWELVHSEGDTCRKSRCRHFEGCHYQRARKSFFTSNLLVANHHILCADLAIKASTGNYSAQALLPAYSRLILDEVHNLEDVATSYFSIHSSSAAITRNLNLLSRIHRNSKRISIRGGLLRRIADACRKSKNGHALQTGLEKDVKAFEKLRLEYFKTSDTYFETASEFLFTQAPPNQTEVKARLPELPAAALEWNENFINPVLQIAEKIHAMTSLLEKIASRMGEMLSNSTPEKNDLFDVLAYIRRLRDCADTFSKLREKCPEDQVRWVTAKKNKYGLFFGAYITPLSIGKPLEASLYSHVPTIVMASATISTRDNSSSSPDSEENGFSFFNNRVGLNLLSPEKTLREEMLPHNFRYHAQCVMHIPEKMPDPKSAEYTRFLSGYILQAGMSLGGRTLVLFTSYRQMGEVWDLTHARLAEKNITVYKQGDAPRNQLLEKMRKEDNMVLLGVSSFWEGIDIPGPNLSCLIIAKLPFTVPTEPVYEARAEAIDKNGGNSFMDYSLPWAVIKFKQGFGRLIRSTSDTGIFAPLDRRLIDKRYGSSFISALPQIPILRGSDFSQVKSEFDRLHEKVHTHTI